MGGEGVWWVQVRRGKNPRQGESLDKDKTDSSTTNKQDPQDTPVGRRISCKWHKMYLCRLIVTATNWCLTFFDIF